MVNASHYGRVVLRLQGACAAASPSDVRRGYALPLTPLKFGAGPLVRPLAHKTWGKARTKGTAHSEIKTERRGIASPHIRRPSRR